MTTLLDLRNVSRNYSLPRRKLFGPAPVLQAVKSISLTLKAGETLGIVGESGSGKSTLARMIMGFERPDAGTVSVLGKDLSALPAREMVQLRSAFQMVFQDPFSSLDRARPWAGALASPS